MCRVSRCSRRGRQLFVSLTLMSLALARSALECHGCAAAKSLELAVGGRIP